MSAWIADRPARGAQFGTVFPPDTEWLALQPAEEVIDPGLPIVDAHHHLWAFPGNRYLLDAFAADMDSGHRVIGTVFAECATMYREDGPEPLRPLGQTEFAARMGMQRTLSGAHICAGIIGFVDLTLGAQVAPLLEAHLLAGQGRFKGVRHSAGWDADPRIGNSHTHPGPGLYRDARLHEGLAAVSRRGLVLDVWAYHPQLGDVLDLARRFPDLSIVVNHLGGPLGYGPYEGRTAQVFATWKTSIEALARQDNVSMKLGGMTIRLAAFDYLSLPAPLNSRALAVHWQPYMDTCIDAFGAARCMFESNFPVEKIGTGYRTLWNAFKRLAAGCSDNDRTALFAGTANRIYDLGLTAEIERR